MANRVFDELRLTVQSAGLVVMGVVALSAAVKRLIEGQCVGPAGDQDCAFFLVTSVICFGLAYAFRATAQHVASEATTDTGGQVTCSRCRRAESMLRLSRLHAVPFRLTAFTDSTAVDLYCRRCKRVLDACLVGFGVIGVAAVTYYLGWW